MATDEFYIGWMAKAPRTFAQHIKKVLAVLALLLVLIAVLLPYHQKPFGTGNFEFGKLTAVQGIYYATPVPSLKATNGKDIFGRPCFITIPLIGFGKSGAAGVISGIEHEKHLSLNGKEVVLQGTLLYNDGKLLMQVDANDSVLLKSGAAAATTLLPEVKDLGEQTLQGEIVDPKCFFGVMKPGEGKPHKDCAIRCILGGIPPVLKVKDAKGNQNYYLLLNENGSSINESIKDVVAAPVTLRATVKQYDDWIILYVKRSDIAPFSYLRAHFGNTIASCNTVCAQ